MNMNQSPSIDQLAKLFDAADDAAGHHVLWIDHSGNVHLSLVTSSPLHLEQTNPSMQVRLATFSQGTDYVGRKAATDSKHLADTLARLVNAWTPPFTADQIRYVEW